MSAASGSSAVPATAQSLFVGIDVSQDKLDLARSDRDLVATFTNDTQGILAIVQQLSQARPQRIVLESTGGLERPLLEALLEAELPVCLVHPGRVRYFAIGLGILAKNDRLDARVLCRFAELANPRLTEKRSKIQLELHDLVACRRQLGYTRAQQSNRLGATANKMAAKSIQAVIDALQKQIDKLDKRIRELIDADDDFKHLDRLMQSVPGVGPVLSATLVAELSELGGTDRRHISALVGVAPFDQDSGSVHGKRSIHGGRAELRSVLYMATLAAIRSNPVIKAFSDRLRAGKKVPKVRIVACMRKLLALLNAMVRDGVEWDQLNVVRKLAINH